MCAPMVKLFVVATTDFDGPDFDQPTELLVVGPFWPVGRTRDQTSGPLLGWCAYDGVSAGD